MLLKEQMSKQSLVLCGGGAYGSLLLGGIHQLNLENIRMIAGTSAGAVIGALLCIGYNARDIQDRFVAHVPMVCHVDIRMLFTDYGLYDTTKYIDTIRDMISEKTSPYITFAELYTCFEKDLVVTGTNVTRGTACYFNRFDHPDMRVLDALSISTRVPFVFPCDRYSDEVYVDGAIVDNLPVVYTESYLASHYSESFQTHVLNIHYRFDDICIDSFSNYVIHLLILFVNQKTNSFTNTSNRVVYNLMACDLVPITTSDNSILQKLFESGQEQIATQLKEQKTQQDTVTDGTFTHGRRPSDM
jgi:predicted acylesterase/phospholipase RssA